MVWSFHSHVSDGTLLTEKQPLCVQQNRCRLSRFSRQTSEGAEYRSDELRT